MIKLTEENDAMKKEFNSTGDKFLHHLKSVESILEDRTIDNTVSTITNDIQT